MAASVASYNGSSIFVGTTRGHIFRLNENSLAPIDYSPFLVPSITSRRPFKRQVLTSISSFWVLTIFHYLVIQLQANHILQQVLNLFRISNGKIMELWQQYNFAPWPREPG